MSQNTNCLSCNAPTENALCDTCALDKALELIQTLKEELTTLSTFIDDEYDVEELEEDIETIVEKYLEAEEEDEEENSIFTSTIVFGTTSDGIITYTVKVPK